MKDWWIMRGDGHPRDDWTLPDPPAWRAFGGQRSDGVGRGASFVIDDGTLDIVNMALLLRRPLLVTGEPGTGKSTLAFAIAHELKLGRVLYWPVNSKSTLRESLYDYDAIGRLHQTNLLRQAAGGDGTAPDIGAFITLGPLGTALLPVSRPRVLLVDEIDKADIDLPNDLLNIFEEGSYQVPELARLAKHQAKVEVGTADLDGRAVITAGRVRCDAFPVVVLTSNRERDFPPAFLRRCVQLDLDQPDQDKLGRIVQAHLPEADDRVVGLVTHFLARRERNVLATDQLLNAVYLLAKGSGRELADKTEATRLLETLYRSLDGAGST
jgi:MoxR-like ATPase